MKLLKILKSYWGYDAFRPLQEDIINSVLEGNDALALMPTGGGKSLCFQVPAMTRDGICMVISPLIALMKDQVRNLRERGIPAVALYAGLSLREVDVILDNCVYGNIKFLYLSPERLTTEVARTRIPKMDVNLIAVDEAHCISKWGHDFRPTYLRIAELRELIPEANILALTATATPAVRENIIERLNFREGYQVFSKSFSREKLSYVVRQEEDKLLKLTEVFEKVKGPGIVYVRTRRKTRELAEYLLNKGFSADYYHAGLKPETRSAKQDSWINDQTRIIVSTNAFGMGIDKPDVRLVAHYGLPDSLEAYYQEAGRAGRDGRRAYAVALINERDKRELKKRIKEYFPSFEEVKTLYTALFNYCQIAAGAGEGISFDFDIREFCKQYGLSPVKTHTGLKLLEQQELISLSEAVFTPSRVMVLMDKTELYRFQIANAKFEPLIKLILRKHGGVFENFVKISERDLAKPLNLTPADVQRYLFYMHRNGVVAYAYHKEKPQITFIAPRADMNHVPVNKAFVIERRDNYITQLKHVMEYVENDTVCRNKVLVKYFGEDEQKDCGICDICLSNSKKNIAAPDYNAISSNMADMLAESSLPVREVVSRLNSFRREDVLKTIEQLMESERLIQLPDKKLKWNK